MISTYVVSSDLSTWLSTTRIGSRGVFCISLVYGVSVRRSWFCVKQVQTDDRGLGQKNFFDREDLLAARQGIEKMLDK